MRQELPWSSSKPFVSFKNSLVFSYAFGLAFVPLGYYFMLAMLCYFYAKENEEKYVFLAGYAFACSVRGLVFTYEQLILIVLWLFIVTVLQMLWHHQFFYMYVSGAILSFAYSTYLGIPQNISLIYLAFYLISTNLLMKLLFKHQEALIYMGISIVILLYLSLAPMYLTSNAMYFLLSLFLIAITNLLKLPYLLSLVLLACLGETFSFSLYFIPVLGMWALWREANLSSIMMLGIYLLLIYIVDASLIYVINGGIVVAVVLQFRTQMEETKIVSKPSDRSIVLLKQFARLCKELSSQGMDTTLIQVMGDVFEKSANELMRIEEYEHFPSLIKEALEVYAYPIKSIELYYEQALYIKLQLYDTSKQDIMNNLLPILESVLHTKLYLKDYERANLFHKYHECMLVLNPCIQIKYDSIQRAYKEVCGDELRVLSYLERKVFMLSDGMGSGYQAQNQSRFALSFLSELFLLGVPFPQMIKVLNQMLLLKQSESFATLDILCIDTLSKRCYLYKAGSAQTYLIRENTVHLFEAESLPLGIVSKIAPDVFCFDLKEGDSLVMMSDGAECEQMERYLLEIKEQSPSAYLKYLYSKIHKEVMEDDLTLLAIRIQNNFHFH